MRHLVGLLLIGLAGPPGYTAFTLLEHVYSTTLVPGSLFVEHLVVFGGHAFDAFWAGIVLGTLAVALIGMGGFALFGSSAAEKPAQ
jgi:hypothetical protein